MSELPPLAHENFEPYENFRPIPLTVLMIAIALAIWGGLLLLDNSQAVAVGQAQRAEELTSLPALSEQSGAQLFEAKCATCHQPNGSGVRDAIPPLAQSPFLEASPRVAVNILLHGIDGPLRVGDKTYDGHMPNFSSVLADAEIARLVTHIRAQFAGQRDAVSPQMVARERALGANRSAWQGGAELARAFGDGLAPQPAFVVAPTPVPPAVQALVNQGRGGAWACASCHGAMGQGSVNVPRLAGLPADYIAKQLGDYVTGARRNESMAYVARTLSRADRAALGAYYSTMRAPSTARPSLGGDLVRGEQLVLAGDWSRNIPACTSCHGPSAFGVAPEFPALAAQHPAYTAGQLAAWVSGERDNARQKLMNAIARNLSDADRRAVSDYLATLPPVPATQMKEKSDGQ